MAVPPRSEPVLWPSLTDIDEMGERALRVMWRSLPLTPESDEQMAVLERLAVRVEGMGMVDKDGKLVG